MLFRKRVERAYELQKEQLGEHIPEQEELPVEKSDWFAMSVAGYLTLLVPAILALGFIALVVYLLLM